MSLYSDIIDLILSNEIKSKEGLHKNKIRLCKKYNIDDIPPDSEILANISPDFSDEKFDALIKILRKKPMRTISGVAIIAVMTSPKNCPHGQCVPCNRNKHGNLHEYRKGILNRITPDQLKWLDEHRHDKLRLTIPEIKKMIDEYKQKIKEHEHRRNNATD